jgi:hypothetical protein
MDIRVEGDQFSMKLTNGMSEKIDNQLLPGSNGLANVQKRLTLLYPEIHELKMTTEQEMFIVLLNIRLTDNAEIAVEEQEIDFAITRNEKTTMSV